jgi:hypothetical protein
MRRWRWTEALAHWDQALNGAGSDARPYWHLERAITLRRLVRFEEAGAVLHGLLRAQPGFAGAWLELSKMLTAAGKFEDALCEASIGDDTPALIAQRIDVLIRLQRLEDATAEFRGAVARVGQPSDLDHLFPLVPRFFEGWQRTQAWLLLQHRMREDADPTLGASATAATLALRVLLALKDYQGFLSEIDRLGEDEIIGDHRALLISMAKTLREPGFPDRRKPKVFGIGLSRTGTTPLALALSILGFTALHFSNPVTGEVVSEADLDLVDAATDTPVCVSFEKLYHLYPFAKFIYTTRPFAHWQPSFCRYFDRRWGTSDFATIAKMLMRARSFHFGAQWSAIHLSLYFNHANYADAYSAFDRRVRNFFRNKPEDRYLEFDVFSGDGWAKLCPFLGRPIPSQPFPQPLA